ncbi:hypothetical protein ACX9NE_20385 [Mycobacterium sp. ML4]
MAPTLKVDLPNVRAGANKIDDAKVDVGQISVPAPGAAAVGLSGFATAGALFAASDAIAKSLKVVAGRYEEMAQVIRHAADAHERADNATAASPSLSTVSRSIDLQGSGPNYTRIVKSWCARGCVALVLLAAGCGHTAPPGASTNTPSTASGYELPATIHYSNHWIGTPAVDLMSADGTFIRAFAEGIDVRLFNINAGEGSYPGFVHANQTHRSNFGSKRDATGYVSRWVLSFAVQPDDSVVADVCNSGSITLDGSDAPDVALAELRYVRVGKAPPVNQQGPAPAPAVSVFGDWYATFYLYPGDRYDPSPCFPSQPPLDKSPVSTPGWPSKESL